MMKRGLKVCSKLGVHWSFQKILFLVVIVLVGLWGAECVDAAPQIEFVDPTPSDGANISTSSVEINVSITESSLGEMKFNWNGVNYTFYDDSLVLMMNFDNVSAIGENDTYVVDVSKYGNNGTVTDAIINSTGGKYGGAFDFDGDGDYVDVNGVPLTNETGYTISAWIKPNGAQDNLDPIIYDPGGGKTGFRISSTNNIQFTIRNKNNDFISLESSGTLTIDGWNLVTIVYDFSSDRMIIYLNGNYYNSKTNVGGLYATYFDGSCDFDIGGLPSLSRWFNGTIDEVRIWNRSFSANEVKQHYYGNLYKYDLDKWNFYINEADLNIDNNTYFVTASNSSGSENLTETRTIRILAKTTKYYDNRKAVVIWTGDDADNANINKFINASYYARDKKVVLSAAIITSWTNSSSWSSMQTEMVDRGFVSPVSHSVSHQNVPYDNTTREVCDSRLDIIGNLTLPWQNQFNGSEYLVGWVEPGGQSDSAVRGNLSECNYLSDRATSLSGLGGSWASWDNSDELYARYNPTVNGDNDNLTTLNNAFDTVYSDEAIYHLYMHPKNHNWTETDKIPQHLSYIGNRTDVWYVGWGQLYMYHYLEDRVTPTVNLTTRNNQIITAKINASGTERNKYGLSYPITYAFAIPSVWSNVFVFYKNQSNENYTLMTEKTSSDFFNGIDVYRTNLSENGVYVSKGFPQTSNEFYLKIVPILSTNFRGDTTDLTAVNLSNITNLVLENSNYGKINFSESVNLHGGADLNTHVNISHNRISINSTALSELNKSATLTLYNLTITNPRVLRDGAVCPSSICTEVGYSGGNFTFTVTSFSAYSAEETPTSSKEPSLSVSGGGHPTFKPTQEQLKEGYEKSLRKNWKMHFEFNNETHTIKLDNIVNRTAIITVSSEGQTFNLSVNETKKLNLDDDNYYDLHVLLKDTSDYRADLVLKLIHEEIPKCQLDWQCSKWGECISNIQTRVCTDLNDCNLTEGRLDEVRDCEPKTDYITIVIVSALIAAAVIAGFLVRKHLTKRKRKRSHFC